MVKKSADNKRIGAGKPGPGRPKGSPNKTTAAIKDMVIAALEAKGGAAYLQKQADDNPTAFLTLVGKVLPLQLTNGDGEGFKITVVTGVPKSGD